jgi:hypothetical protein
MVEDKESFRDELIKLAEIVEKIEDTFLTKSDINITTKMEENDFHKLLYLLNYNTNDTKCIISIGDINFTFLKK